MFYPPWVTDTADGIVGWDMQSGSCVHHSTLGLVVFKYLNSDVVAIDGTPSVTDGLNVTVCMRKIIKP